MSIPAESPQHPAAPPAALHATLHATPQAMAAHEHPSGPSTPESALDPTLCRVTRTGGADRSLIMQRPRLLHLGCPRRSPFTVIIRPVVRRLPEARHEEVLCV